MSLRRQIAYGAVRVEFDDYVMLPSIRATARDAREAAGRFYIKDRPEAGWRAAKANGYRLRRVKVEALP